MRGPRCRAMYLPGRARRLSERRSRSNVKVEERIASLRGIRFPPPLFCKYFRDPIDNPSELG